jgi:hypothetical protein
MFQRGSTHIVSVGSLREVLLKGRFVVLGPSCSRLTEVSQNSILFGRRTPGRNWRPPIVFIASILF